MEKIQLNIKALSVSQAQLGAYALVLEEVDGNRTIPVIIGQQEAQSIALQLEGLHPPRPITHDTFYAFAQLFHISLRRVEIYKLEGGVFYARLIFVHLDDAQQEEHALESRTSDAVAIALRFPNCPIYTTPEILQKAGIVLQSKSESIDNEQNPLYFHKYSDKQLGELLQMSIDSEDYERAAKIRDELSKRQ